MHGIVISFIRKIRFLIKQLYFEKNYEIFPLADHIKKHHKNIYKFYQFV